MLLGRRLTRAQARDSAFCLWNRSIVQEVAWLQARFTKNLRWCNQEVQGARAHDKVHLGGHDRPRWHICLASWGDKCQVRTYGESTQRGSQGLQWESQAMHVSECLRVDRSSCNRLVPPWWESPYPTVKTKPEPVHNIPRISKHRPTIVHLT
jgi:hypothetical protein